MKSKVASSSNGCRGNIDNISQFHRSLQIYFIICPLQVEAFCIAYDAYLFDHALRRRRRRRRCDFGKISVGSSIPALWQEYEDAQTPEAKLVKDFDKASLANYTHCLSKVASLSLKCSIV